MSATAFNPKQEIAREDVLAHLQQLLADRRFVTAERNAQFLRYVVEGALDGRSKEIKETVIATEVYGRSITYDPKTDSIVRVEASRLRQKLRNYYENEGKASAIRVHLPTGSYVPLFEKLDSAHLPQDALADVCPEPLAAPDVRRWRAFLTPRVFMLSALFAAVISLSIQVAAKSNVAVASNPDALAAWSEGIALLQQDPHSGQTISGPPKTLLRAIERLEFAVVRDPKLAPAWATLSEAYDYASGFTGRDPAEDAGRAEAAARRAIALDNKLAAGHHMLGLALKGVKWDFARAEAAYQRALSLDPNNAYAVVEYADLLWETGRVEKAAEEIRSARALLPALPVLAVKQAEIELHLGRPDAAMVTAGSAIDLNRTYMRAHVALGMAYEMKGDSESALARYKGVLLANPSDRRALPAYGYLLARTGAVAQAREIAARLETINSTVRNCAFQVAVVYAGLGDDDLVLDWLEKAWRTRQAHFPFAAVELRFRRFHENVRFRELLSRAGLKPVT